MNADEIVKALHELGDALDKQPTDWPTGGDICYNAVAMIDGLQAQLAETRLDRNAEEAFKNHYKAQLAAERSKYAELQRYNVDCTQACDRQMVEILELREQNAQLSDARNELCQRCGRYHEAHKGACDGCRWKEMPQ